MFLSHVFCCLIKLQGATAVVFCIGGPFGHGPQVRERANVSVKLSAMVLNHQVAFLVLLEQIYRLKQNSLLNLLFLILEAILNFQQEHQTPLRYALEISVGVLLQGMDNTSW